jgi:hypothetical protein
MTAHMVVMLGGPLDGQVMAVQGRHVVAEDPDSNAAAVTRRQLLYATGRVVFCGRTIWVGYLGAKPSDDDLARVLLSPAAHEAMEPGVPDGYDAHGGKS